MGTVGTAGLVLLDIAAPVGTASVPAPASLLMLATGGLGLLGVGRLRRKASAL